MFYSLNWGRIGLCFGMPIASVTLSVGFTLSWAIGLVLAALGAYLAGMVVCAEWNRFQRLPAHVRSNWRYEDYRASGFFFLEL